MSTQFHATNSFPLESRHLFVISGSIIEGEVRAGMFINIPFNSQINMTVRIHSVEFTRFQDREDVSLCIQYDDSSELQLWRTLRVNDETIDISDEDND